MLAPDVAPEERTRSTSVVLPTALLAAIAAIAADKGVSISAVVRWGMEAYVKRQAPRKSG